LFENFLLLINLVIFILTSFVYKLGGSLSLFFQVILEKISRIIEKTDLLLLFLKIIIKMKEDISNEELIKVVDEDRYCIDISDQLLASIGLLKSLNKEVINAHLEDYVVKDLSSKNEEEIKKKANEISNTINKLLVLTIFKQLY